MLRITRPPLLALAMFVGSFALGGCGDSDSSSSVDAGASGDSGAAGSAGSGGNAQGGTGGSAGAAGSSGTGGSAGTGGSSGASGTGATDASTDGVAPSGSACAPLPMAGRIVDLDPSGDLVSAVRDAAAGDTIVLADGTYPVGGQILQMHTDGVTLRGGSGNREAVVIDGERSATSGEVISVTASDVTIADLTIQNAYTHAIHVQSTDAGDVLRTTIFNVHVLDALEQGIKINLNAAETRFPDDGTIACSHIELTSAGRSAVRNNCYTGGIDAHGSRGWHIRDNLIEGFYCPTGLSEHGVHFWTGSRDTIVERNRIVNCARGVGFGLGETTASSSDAWRTYADSPCGAATPVGHYGGVIRNNFIFANEAELFASQFGFDTGIAFEQACAAVAVHNTVYSSTPPLSSAIEWRFANTSARVLNNLANAALRDRGSGAMATASGNIDTAAASLFVDATSGDLHLVPGATAARGAGSPVEAGLCDDDIDGDARTDPRDVGSDQVGAP